VLLDIVVPTLLVLRCRSRLTRLVRHLSLRVRICRTPRAGRGGVPRVVNPHAPLLRTVHGGHAPVLARRHGLDRHRARDAARHEPDRARAALASRRLLSAPWLASAAAFRRAGMIEQCRGALQEAECADEDNPAVWVQVRTMREAGGAR
jgi:hypothetical protein